MQLSYHTRVQLSPASSSSPCSSSWPASPGRPPASVPRFLHCHCGPGNTGTEIFGDLPKNWPCTEISAPWSQHLHRPLPKPHSSSRHCSSWLPRERSQSQPHKKICPKSLVFSRCLFLMHSVIPSSLARQVFEGAVGPRQGDGRSIKN